MGVAAVDALVVLRHQLGDPLGAGARASVAADDIGVEAGLLLNLRLEEGAEARSYDLLAGSAGKFAPAEVVHAPSAGSRGSVDALTGRPRGGGGLGRGGPDGPH